MITDQYIFNAAVFTANKYFMSIEYSAEEFIICSITGSESGYTLMT